MIWKWCVEWLGCLLTQKVLEQSKLMFLLQPALGRSRGMLPHLCPAAELSEERIYWQFSSFHTRVCSHPQRTPGNRAVIIYYLYFKNPCCCAGLRAGQVGVRAEDVNRIVRETVLAGEKWARPIVSAWLLWSLQFHISFSTWCIKVSPADDPGTWARGLSEILISRVSSNCEAK